MRFRIRSSASFNMPPGKVVEAIVFKLEIMNYELGRTKTAVVSAVLSGVNPKIISFCAETADATASARALAITENAIRESCSQMKTLQDVRRQLATGKFEFSRHHFPSCSRA